MWPLVEVALEPKSPADAEKLRYALCKLASKDLLLSFQTDDETGQAIIHAESEAQLESYIEAVHRFCDVDVDVSRVQVAYLETVGRKTETKYTHRRQTGKSWQYAEVEIEFEPLDRHAGVVFENNAPSAVVPLKYVPAIEKGVRLKAQTGVVAGFPTVDFKFTLKGGRYHDINSSALAFEIAAGACFRQLAEARSGIVLEPVMRIEVVTPGDYAHDIVSDLRKRSCVPASVEPVGSAERVTALIPLSVMLGYSAALDGLSRGSAKLSMRYETHREVVLSEPPNGRFPPASALRA